MEPELYSKLSSETNLVMYRYDEINEEHFGTGVALKHNVDSRDFEKASPILNRDLLQYPTTAYRYGCTTGQDYHMDFGFAMDYGYYRRAIQFDASDPLKIIENIIAQNNLVYASQIGVTFHLGETIVKTGLDSDAWNQDRVSGNCPLGPEPLLEEFTAYQNNQLGSSQMGLWHLMTDCFPPPGVIGIAYVGTLCRSAGFNTGVNTHTGSSTWLTVAHEAGHNFRADHSFEEGQGSTGGIMDYGDGRLNGIYQFNAQYRETEMCQEINEALTSFFSINNCLKQCGSEPGTTCPTYRWRSGSFTACSEECGNSGTRTRVVECVHEDENNGDVVVDDSFCDQNMMPADSEPCNRVECESSECTCTEYGPYGSCEANGVRVQSRTCTSSDPGQCEAEGFSENQKDVCDPEDVEDMYQVYVVVNTSMDLSDEETVKQRFEGEFPGWLSLPDDIFVVTDVEIEDPENEPTVVRVQFYAFTPASTALRFRTLQEGGETNEGSGEATRNHVTVQELLTALSNAGDPIDIDGTTITFGEVEALIDNTSGANSVLSLIAIFSFIAIAVFCM
jgi:hypothetical protein